MSFTYVIFGIWGRLICCDLDSNKTLKLLEVLLFLSFYVKRYKGALLVT